MGDEAQRAQGVILKTNTNRLVYASGVILLFSACVALDTNFYKSDCLCIAGGEVNVNSQAGTYSFTAMNIDVEPPPCIQMGHVNVKTGIDSNGDGKLTGDEILQEFNDGTPGGHVVIGGVSGEPLPSSDGNVLRETTVTATDGSVIHSGTETSGSSF